MPELLLELLSEEIPARMQRRAAEQLRDKLFDLAIGLGFAGRIEREDVAAYATPRRLVGVVRDIPAEQPEVVVERKGPREGSPQGAIDGFLKAAGLKSLSEAERRDTGKGVFYFASSRRPGRATLEVLAERLPELIRSFEWPKSMRWGAGEFRWVRPLQGILCLFGGRVVPGRLGLGDGAELAFGDATVGHRFHAPQRFAVVDFRDYGAKLEKASVILDAADRRAMIKRAAEQLAGGEGCWVRDDPGLLDEVAGLVEWPVAMLGKIDPAFMDLPREVLIVAMRTHQRYFALERTDDKLAPRFVVVANSVPNDGGRAVVAGNERVLRARLSDARFFWDQDLKKTLVQHAERLDRVAFFAGLGSLAEKAQRVFALAEWLAVSAIAAADREMTGRAARLCKADLVTGLVGEFPELQGVMGRYYALHHGEPKEVADAIAEHYAPLGPKDACPKTPVSVAVALADKLDTLTGFFAIGEKPTGSRDPLALRRAAISTIRLIVENGVRLPLLRAFAMAFGLHAGQNAAIDRSKIDAVGQELMEFFADRLKAHLRDEGVRHDLISAVFAVPGGEDDLVRLLARVEALKAFLDSDDGANLLVAYRRAANILKIEEKKDKTSYDRLADPAEFSQGEEARLFKAIGEVASRSDPYIAGEDFAAAMSVLSELREPVDDFFDKVTVNADEPALRRNRLCLLSQIRVGMNAIADFSRIEG